MIDTIHAEALTKGYLQVPKVNNVPFVLLKEANEAFLRVLEDPHLDHELLCSTQIHLHPECVNETPLGFTRKQYAVEDGVQTGDSKWYVHYHPAVHKKLITVGQQVNSASMARFISAAQKLYKEAEIIARRTVLYLENCGLQGIREQYIDSEKNVPGLTIRFLAYDVKQNSFCFSARGHYDKSGMTIPLFESHPGLFVGPREDVVDVLEYGRSNVVLMGGLALKEQHDINPCWHYVQQLDGEGVSATVARNAIVAFVDPIEPFSVSVAEAHTPLH